MTLGHILRQLLSVALALACAHAVPVRAQHDDRAADAVQLDRTPAIRDALDAAREAAARIRNPLRSTEGMVRVADVAWDYDPETSQKTFERAFDLLMVELRAGGQRAAAARPYMEFALELYARHAWERAVDFTLLYATSYLPTTPDDRFRLATLLAGLGLDHAQTNRARAADLARRSIQTGIATTELAQLLGELDSPDRYRLVLASVRLARAQRDGLGVLLALNDRIGIVRLDEPQKLGDGSSMELAAEWLQSVRRSLARMAREAAERAADGYALSAADMDPVLRVLASRDGLLDAFKSWRTENTDRAADLLASLAGSVAYIEDTASARADAARSLLPPGSSDLLRMADRAPNESVADALRQRAALTIAHDRAAARREQAVRAVLADIRSLARRDATADLAYLFYAEQAIADGRAYDAPAYVARVSDAGLRCEAAGNAALAVVRVDRDAALELANIARIAAASARPRARVVGGLLAAARAVGRAESDARGLELVRDALGVFDRIDYESESAAPSPGADAYFATFGSARVSPFLPVSPRDLAVRETLASLIAADDEGVRLAVQGVRSADARLDAFLAFALALEDTDATATATPGAP